MTHDNLTDATWVVGLLALCGTKLGGAVVTDDSADAFLVAYENATAPEARLRNVPSSVGAEALTGSLDLATTLALGKPVHARGLLVNGEKAQLLIRRADNLDSTCASLMAQALDHQELLLVAIMNLNDPDAALVDRLGERLPFRVDGDAAMYWTTEDIAMAAMLMADAKLEQKWIEKLCATALLVGISSPRPVLQAVATARAIAALCGLAAVDEPSVAMAARLTLAHRAIHAPPSEQLDDMNHEPENPTPENSEPPSTLPDNADGSGPEQNDSSRMPDPADAELILEAVKAALPPNILQALGDGIGKRAGRNAKSIVKNKASGRRGRRIGTRRATSLARQRLDIIATLRTAAPWQPLRRAQSGSKRMVVTRDDFRVSRIKQRNEATAVFAVDASGSTAFQRLAEAKGAVETILAECYVRRDRVALVAFRGKKAEVLLPPTRSLERARRALAELPGGGGTPLASGLDEVLLLALQVRRAGGNPIVVILTDGRANISRSGIGTKAMALEESLSAARLFAAEDFETMLIDVSPEPQRTAKALAQAMRATYLPMPRAGASDIARPVSAVLKSASS
jgi:magnesium chelatase subunit D